MTAATAAQHHFSELRYVAADLPLAFFEATSSRDQAVAYTIVFDVATKYAECSGTTLACREGRCWHVSPELLFQSYMAELARQYVAKAATIEEVAAIGRHAKAQLDEAGTVWVLRSPLDEAIYRECRAVYRRHLRDAAAIAAATAYVKEWESLSYSDQHIEMPTGMVAYYQSREVLARAGIIERLAA